MKIYGGYKRLARNYTLMTDNYQIKMLYGYFKAEKQNEKVIFDVFFRKVPNNGGYVVMAGLDKVIEYIKDLSFNEGDLEYFREKGYNEDFINYLGNFKFNGDIYAIPDGTPVFPNEPIITVKAKLSEGQFIETAILSFLNGALSHSTGARRIIEATPENVGVMEFGARRADGSEAAIDSSIYGIMAGCIGTSNEMAARMLNMNAMGTMAHSFIESFDSEYEAFLSFATTYPNNCLLLVDTYNTLESGVLNAIKVFEYMRDNNLPLNNIGIRIDSGDLAYLSKRARIMLDEAGFHQAKICLSNGLDDKKIEALIIQGAKFDVIGAGDNISKPNGNIGCVYKLSAVKKENTYIPKIKLSEDVVKIINPGYKKIYRAYDKTTGYAIADIMASYDEVVNRNELVIIDPTNNLKRKTISNFKLVELQQPIFINGQLVYNDPEILDKKTYCNEQMNLIYPEVRRSEMPHQYYVDGTEEYIDLKNKVVEEVKQLVKRR